MYIREYQHKDESSWVRCRVLSFLDTAYFDDVLKEKNKYRGSSIELVAVENEQIIGLIDIEYENKEGTIFSNNEQGLGGMIWHIAVHPDFRRLGIGSKLLHVAQEKLIILGINYLEAWTRDDEWVHKWYRQNEFRVCESYFHVFIDTKKQLNEIIHCSAGNIYPIQLFAHYTGTNKEQIKRDYKRVHECFRYQKNLQIK
ncbi:GNAT family N-acetyltransferase [Priestia megaterium]|uniref:Acetyltransferase family protein n=1 Tax=Priestia megaterium (strain ATCC 14581 / DSM 32 / CCUG 1817 / JCM 2506 / NBRC 15308 / NCIMB 9376 / NCTC 10342 / NRRL B-14308 / VKM B-512 / Ford 19) TaxID=1348623 RepID=A0A0B6AMZ7_PRIM2|nr:GNAT family N-acetyltransferase [Priestia megaterium]AJI22442.1 acetyltransferase family protein [Priestia megaterium NBRC 15308 = ATCC 14581]KFM96928.1 acetyltransferase family protein [Priestia megaterium]KGJ73868.1 GNAT family acetyltransferase [Priestia megaterium NBRC 15308 = ATCC 14581]MDR4231332.1 GNAT family N-acetyltransferase [Priestia megaterium]MED3807599.1 GNAT family N-acetyltransferase [Priestia megaterium]